MAQDSLPNPYDKNRPDLVALVERLFGDNNSEEITPEDARTAVLALVHSAFIKQTDVLRGNQLRGGVHTKTTLAGRDAIELRYREVGMSCVVINPASTIELAAGAKVPAATYQLVQASKTVNTDGGFVRDTYQGYVTDGTRLVNVAWVQTSGTEQERILSYPEFVPENFPYLKADAIQYTFPEGHPQAGVTLCYEARRDMTDFTNPVPTGSKDDENWKPLAPLAAVTHVQDTDQGTDKDWFELGRNSFAEEGPQRIQDAEGNFYRGIIFNRDPMRVGANSLDTSRGFLGAKVQTADGRQVFELVQCKRFDPADTENEFEPIGGNNTGNNTGQLLELFKSIDTPYPNNQLLIQDANGFQHRVNTRDVATMETVTFTEFVTVPMPVGGIEPYTFVKNVIYRDTVAKKAFRCLQTHTVTVRTYPDNGPYFAESDWVTKEFGANLAAQIQNLTSAMYSLPGKMPGFHATTTAGEIYSTLTIGELGGLANYSVVFAWKNTSLVAQFVLRTGSKLNGNGLNLDLAGKSILLGRDAEINDCNILNGVIQGYQTVDRYINNGSLTQTSLDGAGGQRFILHGTRIACAPGFKLLTNGAALDWYGTPEYKNPTLPFGADISGGNINYFPYEGGSNGTPADLSNYYTKAAANAEFGVSVRTDAVIQFTAHFEYATINAATTIDVAGAKPGMVVRVRLGVDAPAPPIPASGFQRLSDKLHTPGKRHIYSFCVAADNSIDYCIIPY